MFLDCKYVRLVEVQRYDVGRKATTDVGCRWNVLPGVEKNMLPTTLRECVTAVQLQVVVAVCSVLA